VLYLGATKDAVLGVSTKKNTIRMVSGDNDGLAETRKRNKESGGCCALHYKGLVFLNGSNSAVESIEQDRVRYGRLENVDLQRVEMNN
jgi:hypothetical protein